MLEKYVIYLIKYPLKNKIKFHVILQILELKKIMTITPATMTIIMWAKVIMVISI